VSLQKGEGRHERGPSVTLKVTLTPTVTFLRTQFLSKYHYN